ncbi:MAG: hypothetical protein Q8878_06045 [Bacillota bacterium]|nr:hypothetical protein [Bacillota bacterium]
MSIVVSNIRLPLDSWAGDAYDAAIERLSVPRGLVSSISVYKRSFDARHGKISVIYSVLLDIPGDLEDKILSDKSVFYVRKKAEKLEISPKGSHPLESPPVIIGFGPAGMFAGLMLAKHGYRPVILEKGPSIDERDKHVAGFFGGGCLDPKANVQFGEGGAGTYSDGKLTTRISDERCELVLNELVAHGAPKEILVNAKPHIGTDLLKDVIKSIRREILSAGGEIRFSTEATGFRTDRSSVSAVITEEGAIPCRILILSVGHSARETFPQLLKSGVFLSSKPFAVGVRIEHPQERIDRALYGGHAGNKILPPAEYALTAQVNGRACYSFCMCPGGSVIAAASEQGGVVTNGMSLHHRNGRNANSAVVVSVNPDDFGSVDPLSGVNFQRKIEQAAFAAGGGNYAAPCVRAGDFLGAAARDNGFEISPTYPRGVKFCGIDDIFPDFVTETIRLSLLQFDKKISGFASSGSFLTAPETRTSSPVRIGRKANTLESVTVSGIIPCGEGAGYAGGIMSAAVDGIKAAERIMEEYKPLI